MIEASNIRLSSCPLLFSLFLSLLMASSCSPDSAALKDIAVPAPIGTAEVSLILCLESHNLQGQLCLYLDP